MISREEALLRKAQYGSWAEASRRSPEWAGRYVPKTTLKDARDRLVADNPMTSFFASLTPEQKAVLSDRAFGIQAPPHIGQKIGQTPPVLSQEDNKDAPKAPYYPDGLIRTVVAIGDHHDKPGRDKTRALWIGRFCAEHRPDAVVSIGDWASLDSLSGHELPGSIGDAERPAFHEEIESLNESLSLFGRHFPKGSAPQLTTHGNHEHRAWRAANKQPKLCGDMPARLDSTFSDHGWDTRPFGEFVDIYGVDFVHAPLTTLGEPMGGENVERNVANKTGRSCVFGHTHRANALNLSRLGQSRSIQIVNLGTSLPHGTVEKYAKLAQTGWTYGVFLLRILDGQILSAKMYDMLELQAKYGD